MAKIRSRNFTQELRKTLTYCEYALLPCLPGLTISGATQQAKTQKLRFATVTYPGWWLDS
jgi:hypothetical protein